MSRVQRWGPLAVFGITFFVYAATISHSFVSPDVWSADFGAWHIAQTGSPWVDGLSMAPLDGNPARSQWVTQVNGHDVITRSPGVIAASVPAYLLLGGANMTVVPAGLAAALLTSVSAVLIYLVVARRRPVPEAALVTFAFTFTTPVWSVAANGMWPHTITVLGIAGMAWAADRDRWWLAGLFGGIALWGRLHAALIVALLGLLVGLRRRDVRPVIQVGVVSGGCLALMSVWTYWMYDKWNPTSSYNASPYMEYDHFSIVNQLGMWVSPDKGFLIWTPVVLLLLPALIRSWRDIPDWSRALVYGGLAYTVLQAALNRFSGGETFYGYRLTLEMLTCLAPALSFSIPHMGTTARRLSGPVLAVQFLAIATGSVADGGFVGDSQRWTTNSFVLVLNEIGPLGYVTVALTAGLGVLGARVWTRHGSHDLSSRREVGT
jgi:alpha-1,2-mannosyltransferase